jgi:hypothetical protein
MKAKIVVAFLLSIIGFAGVFAGTSGCSHENPNHVPGY